MPEKAGKPEKRPVKPSRAAPRHAARTVPAAQIKADQILNLTQGLACVLGTDYSFKYLNPAMQKLLGYSTEELLARPFTDFLHPDERQAYDFSERFASNKGTLEIESRFICKNGSTRRVLWTATLDGDEGLIYCIGQDITKYKEYEDSLAASEQRYRTLVQNCSDGIAVVQDGLLVFANEKAVSMGGYNAAKALGKPFLDVVGPKFAEEIRNNYVRRLEENTALESYEAQFMAANGKLTTVEVRAAKIEHRGRTADLAIIRDITERKEASKALLESEAKFRQVFENNNYSIAIFEAVDWGDNFVFRDLNRRTEQAQKIKRADAIGKKLYEVFPALMKIALLEVFKRVYRTGKAENYPAGIYESGRLTVWNEIFVCKLPDGHIVSMSEDVTERKRASEALRKSESKFRELFENTKSAVAIYEAVNEGQNFIFKDVNRQKEEMIQLKRADVIDRKVTEIYTDVNHEQLLKIFGGVYRTGKPIFLPASPYANDALPGLRETYICKLPDGHIVTMAEDVTERHKMELEILQRNEELQLKITELAEANAYSESLLKSFNDALLMIDLDGIVRDANDVYFKMMGLSREEVLGKPVVFDRLLNQEAKDNAPKDLERVKSSGVPKGTTEVAVLDGTGQKIFLEASYNAVNDSSGNSFMILVTLRDVTERKKVLEELHHSESKFRHLFENTKSSIAIYEVAGDSEDFILKDLNSQAEKLLNIKREAVIGRKVTEVFPSVNQKGLFEIFKTVYRTGEPEFFPATFYKDERIPGWREAYICKLPDGHLVTITDDVTERQKSLEELRNSEEKFRELFENTHDSIVIYEATDDGENFIIRGFNRRAEQLAKTKRENVIGRKVTESFSGLTGSDLFKILQRVYRTGKPEFHPRVRYDDERISGWRELFVCKLPDGHIVSMTDDITDREEHQAELASSEQRYRTIVEKSGDGIVVVQDELIVFANEKILAMGGFTRDELLGKSYLDVASPQYKQPLRDGYIQATAGEEPQEGYESQLVTANGKNITIELNSATIEYEGRPAVMAFIRDITERKKASAELRRSEEKFRGLFENTHESVGIYEAVNEGENFILSDLNRQKEELLKVKREDVIGRKATDIYHDVDKDRLLETFRKVYHTGKPIFLPASPYDDKRLPGLRETYLHKLPDGHIVTISTDVTEREKASADLRQSEKKFKELFENTNDSVFIYEVVGDGENFIFRDINRKAEQTENIKRDDIIGQKVTEVFPSFAKMGFLETFQRVYRTGKPEFFPVTIYEDANVSGSREVYVCKLPDDHIASMAEDVTERIKHLEDLSRSEARFRQLFENTKNCVAIYEATDDGEDFIFREFNRQAEQTENIKSEKVIGRKVTEVFPGVKAFGLFEVFQRVYLTGKPEFLPSTLYKDERIVGWRENYVCKLPDGNIAAIYEDITERKKQEEAVASSEQRYRTLVEKSSDSIVVIQDGLIVFANQRALSTAGYTSTEMLGKSFLDLVAPESIETVKGNYMRRMAGEPAQQGYEANLLTKNGERLAVEINAVKIDYEGKPAVMAFMRDTTERKKQEDEIKHLNLTLRAIRNVSQLIVTERDQDKLIQGVCGKLIEGRGYADAWIILLDDEQNMVSHAESGTGDGFPKLIQQFEEGHINDCARKALSKSEVVLTNNPSKQCLQCPLSTQYAKSKSAMSIRLKSAGKIYGVLTVTATEDWISENPEEHELLQELAGDISLALNNIEAERKRAKAEKALIKSEKMLGKAQEIAALGSWEWDVLNNSITWSEQMYRIFEIDRDSNISTDLINNLIHPDDALTLESNSNRYEKEIRLVLSGNKIKWVNLISEVIYDDAGNLTFRQGTLQDISERRLTEDTLRESERRLNEAQLIANMGDFTWDVETGEVTWSDSLFKLLHYDKSEQIDYTRVNAEIHHPDDLEAVTKWLKDCIASGRSELTPYEYRLVRKDGKAIYVCAQGIIQQREGRLPKVFATIQDITERKRAETELRKERDFSQSLIKTLPVFFLAVNQQDKVIMMNETMLTSLGYTIEEVIGKKYMNKFVPKQEQERLAKTLSPLILQGKPFKIEHPLLKKDGREILTEWHGRPIFKENGKLEYSYAMGIDVTERKQAEIDLRKERDFNQALIETLPVYFLTIDGKGHVLMMNTALLNALGYTPEEVFGTYWPGKFLPETESESIVEELTPVTKQSRSVLIENPVMTKDGRRLLVQWHGSPVLDESGDFDHFFGVGIDITERKQIEEQERELSTMKEVDRLRSELLANVSHELRTPLQTIKGYATMMEEYDDRLSVEEKRRYLKSIDAATIRLTELIDQLLDMSRLEMGMFTLQKERASITKLLKQSVEEAKFRYPKHSIVIEKASKLPMIRIDSIRIRQVIDNLLDNAAKYSAEGTTITVSLKRQKSAILLSIADQGKGIPSDDLDKIFDRMYRIHERLSPQIKGVGLGLAIAKKLIDAHGGNIWAESELDKGSTLYVTIPINEPDEPSECQE